MKGQTRELDLDKRDYFGDSYFSMPQLCALSHQLNIIHKIKPNSVLEIGIGNGFTSTFLKRAGIEVCTVDINANLTPDIICPLNELPKHLINRRFDLVVCCEVLEHIPFEEFERSLEIFKLYSNNLFLTLPSYPTWFGLSGFVRMPKINKLLSVGISVKRKKNMAKHIHFWELCSGRETSKSNIELLLSKQYRDIEHGVFHLNRYHEYYICKN